MSIAELSRISRAQDIAMSVHANQFRKVSKKPYFLHLIETPKFKVATLLKNFLKPFLLCSSLSDVKLNFLPFFFASRNCP